jgi:hypothetical protein
MNDQPRLSGRPERIFVSVDQSTGRSTISFAPTDAGSPFQREDDADGALAMRDARAILTKYPGATIHGPHFHAAPTRRPRARGRT